MTTNMSIAPNALPTCDSDLAFARGPAYIKDKCQAHPLGIEGRQPLTRFTLPVILTGVRTSLAFCFSRGSKIKMCILINVMTNSDAGDPLIAEILGSISNAYGWPR